MSKIGSVIEGLPALFPNLTAETLNGVITGETETHFLIEVTFFEISLGVHSIERSVFEP